MASIVRLKVAAAALLVLAGASGAAMAQSYAAMSCDRAGPGGLRCRMQPAIRQTQRGGAISSQRHKGLGAHQGLPDRGRPTGAAPCNAAPALGLCPDELPSALACAQFDLCGQGLLLQDRAGPCGLRSTLFRALRQAEHRRAVSSERHTGLGAQQRLPLIETARESRSRHSPSQAFPRRFCGGCPSRLILPHTGPRNMGHMIDFGPASTWSRR